MTEPIVEGRLCLGSRQGIFRSEHRGRGGPWRLLLAMRGEAIAGRLEPDRPRDLVRRDSG